MGYYGLSFSGAHALQTTQKTEGFIRLCHRKAMDVCRIRTFMLQRYYNLAALQNKNPFNLMLLNACPKAVYI